MSTGSLALKDITVLIDRGDQYNVSIRPSDNYNVSVTTGDQYIVNVMQPGAISVNSSGSYFSIADSALTAVSASFAQTASYALNVSDTSAFPFTGSAEISGSLLVTGGTISGSFIGNGSGLIGVSASVLTGGLKDYIPLWASNSTLTSSIIYQTGSSIILNGTAPFYPQYPETLGIYNYSGTSYNLIIGHGRIDNYIQFNIKNESSGAIASSDIVATADNGDEYQNYVNMGINSSQYTASFGGPNDAYFFSTGNKLLIGNANSSESILLFAGGYPQNDESLVKLRISPFNQHELTGSLSISDNLIVDGRVTANELVVSTVVSSSIIYESGSTKFGDTSDDVHQFTGSVFVNGIVSGSSFTGSFKGDGSQLTGIATDLRISGSTGSDVLSLLTDTLSVLGTNGVTTTVTDNFLTINIPLGIVSSSAQVLNYNLFATTGSNIFVGDQTITGSLLTDADTLILTGSILVDGTMEINGVITGSIVQAISASYIDGGFY